jgi:ZIP family zinc transporter
MSAILLTFIVGLFTIIGIVLGNYFKDNNKFINISFGMLFSFLVLSILLRIIPNSYHLLNNLDVLPDIKTFVGINNFGIIILAISSIIGYLTLKLLDSFIPNHGIEQHYRNEKKDKIHFKEHLKHIGILIVIILLLHNIIEGMLLFVDTTNSFKSGLISCISLGLGNILVGILVSIALDSIQLKTSSIILVLSTLIGGITMFIVKDIISEALVGVLLSVTFGMLIYFALFELLPRIIHSTDKKASFVGLTIGIVINCVSLLLG